MPSVRTPRTPTPEGVDKFDFSALDASSSNHRSTAVFLDVLKALAIYPGRSAIGFAALVGKRQNILSVHLVVQRVEARSPRFVVQRLLQLLNTTWGC